MAVVVRPDETGFELIFPNLRDEHAISSDIKDMWLIPREEGTLSGLKETRRDEVSFIMSTAEAPRTVTASSVLELQLDCHSEAVGPARHLVGEYLARLEPSVERDTREAVILVVSELVTNAVRHAGGKSCTLRLLADPETIMVSVGDASPVLPRPRTPDVTGEGGGFGWSMVCRIAETVEVSRGSSGKTVTATIPRQVGRTGSGGSADATPRPSSTAVRRGGRRG
ncbi:MULTISPECIES: ATP-binding protein [Streptomyces]|uniref:ATP-binding protein n=1 Tax=Streptomyces TaxID=1883 RepID=UPI002555F0A7|nr:ATP-binding protein [Streptomyces sp. NBRC 13847]